MPTYISLLSWTDQGIRNLKQAPDRARQAEQLAQQMGGKLTGVYLTMGQYDIVTIFEAPDDEAAARMLLTLGSQGNVRTTTLKAFSRDELERIVRSVG
jgi:uncharacterized protein with GYD domain